MISKFLIKKLYVGLFILFQILLIPIKADSQQNILLNDSSLNTVIREELVYFNDSTKKINPDSIYKLFKNGSFNKTESNALSESATNCKIWFGCNFVNTLNFSEDYLLIFPSWDTIQVFIFKNGFLVQKLFTGTGFSVNQKTIKDSRNLIKININQRDTISCIVTISGEFSIENSYDLYFEIAKQSTFLSDDYSERYFQGIFLGVIFIMILYNLFLYVSIRQRSYLYYVLMLLGSGIIWVNNFSFEFDYLFTNTAPSKIINMGSIFSAFFGTFLILFTKNFLETKKLFKKSNIYLNILIFIVIIIPTIQFIYPPLRDIAKVASFLSGILTFISILIISVYAVIKKYRPARYFFLANLFFSIGTIIFILGNIQVFEPNYFSFHGMQFGQIFEIALFSLALADRINILKKENEEKQLQIIQQLTENEKLKDKVNRELEQKVKERTAEILQQKEEIEAQRDEIEAQRNIVIQQKEHIEEIHKEVTDSINYAQRIQQAMLPDFSLLGNQLAVISNQTGSGPTPGYRLPVTDYFILFRPKDVVSGDFYWATKANDWFIVCVADCTGHGVPGAFMSMLGISFLNEIVRKKEVTKANRVLNELRKSIIEALKQTGESGTQKDGMDISLITINTTPQAQTSEGSESSEVLRAYNAQWAGANNPLYVIARNEITKQSISGITSPSVRNDEIELHELKGDKMPIAIYERMDEFKNHELQLFPGDLIYLKSDGYEDQFGGSKSVHGGKKFLSKNLKQLLIENYRLNMNEQRNILEKTLKDWIGDGEQIDDITILGIKI